MENDDDYHFKFKVLLVGDKGVGKTSLLDCNLPLTQRSRRSSAR